jgi:hypothetical protein
VYGYADGFCEQMIRAAQPSIQNPEANGLGLCCRGEPSRRWFKGENRSSNPVQFEKTRPPCQMLAFTL